MSSATPPTEYFPGINFNPSFYNLGSSAVSLDYLNSNFLRSTGYAISRAQFTLFNGSVDINENLDVSGNINASAYLVNNVPVSFSQWTTSGNDIYYNTGNVGIGKTNPSANYILDVSGNINADKIFRSGTELTQYTDTNVRTVLSTSAGTNMTWNTGTNKFDVAAPYTDTNTRTVLSTSAGTNMTWNTGTNKFDVSVPPSYTDTNTRTVLSTSAGTNMTWNTGTNRFDVAAPYTDANVRTVLSNSAGTNMTWNTGTNQFDVNVISSQWTTTGSDIYYTAGKVGIGLTNPSSSGAALQINGTVSLSSSANTSFFWSGFTNTLIGRANTAGTYSSSAGVGDLVLSSNNKIIIKSGASTNPIAMCVDTSNNVGIGKTNPSQNLDVSGNILALRLGVGTTSILSNYSLDVSGNIITTGNIALVNGATSIFWTGTNSNLGRAGTGNTYSTSAATNDIVLRSDNKLLLQSGVGAAALVIDTSNRVGIGITPTLNVLHLHKTGAVAQDVKISFTDALTGTNATDGIEIGKQSDNKAVFYNNENADMIFGTGGALRLTIKANGAIGIQNSGYAIPNNYMSSGSLTIGNTGINYGGGSGWNTSTAGLMLECLDSTEIAVHDSGTSIHSLLHYSTNGNITIGRNMGYNAANVNISGNLSVGGTNINSIIDQRIKNQHLFHVYRVSITYYNFGLISQYWEGVWDFETNLKFNEYSRPDLNVRWNISGSINNGNGNDSNKYFFMNFFYNKLGNSIQYHATHSYGTWTFQNYWNSQGNNYLRIICRLDAAADYLNINIS